LKRNEEKSMAESQGRRYYIEGNTARALDVRRAIEEEPRKKLSNQARKNRERAYHMSFGYVLFLAAALFVAGYVLIGYIQLQADITNQVETIASLESELNHLKLANDEELTRINSSINLEEIKAIAIGELGMVYATEGQIVNYTNEGSDYVRQLADIPKE
jgi:cell division protein FtsB